jgi:membrane protein required for beta-lactamase induction
MLKLSLTLLISVGIGMAIALMLPFWVNGALFGIAAVCFWMLINYMNDRIGSLLDHVDRLTKDANEMESTNEH